MQNWKRRKFISAGFFTLGITATSSISNSVSQAQNRNYTGFARIISRQFYEQAFPSRNPIYTYDNLVKAARAFSAFCNEGSNLERKREAAAFLAHIHHETGGLKKVNEDDRSQWNNYCDQSIQLSWNYNYRAFGEYIGQDLLNNPNLVATNGYISFLSAVWFWMTPQGSIQRRCHDAILTSGFGETINIINGFIECGGKEPEKVKNRVALYNYFCRNLGISSGKNLYC
jgi:chitinase